MSRLFCPQSSARPEARPSSHDGDVLWWMPKSSEGCRNHPQVFNVGNVGNVGNLGNVGNVLSVSELPLRRSSRADPLRQYQ